jgi:hypothetical protein
MISHSCNMSTRRPRVHEGISWPRRWRSVTWWDDGLMAHGTVLCIGSPEDHEKHPEIMSDRLRALVLINMERSWWNAPRLRSLACIIAGWAWHDTAESRRGQRQTTGMGAARQEPSTATSPVRQPQGSPYVHLDAVEVSRKFVTTVRHDWKFGIDGSGHGR